MKQYKDTRYFVMEDGVIIGKSGKVLKPRKRGDYLSVRIANGDIKKGNTSIHRMVAEIYVPNPNKKDFVNHIDGNKYNNSANNLEWVTRSENQLHAYKLGLQKTNKKNKQL